MKVLRPSVDLSNRLLYSINKKEFDTNTDVVASEDKDDISRGSDHVSLTSSSFDENVSVANKPKIISHRASISGLSSVLGASLTKRLSNAFRNELS